MEKIIIANKEDNVHFVPEVPISIIESPREQSAVESMIRNATSMDVNKFKELLGKRKRESLTWVSSKNWAVVEDIWVKQHYYQIFQEVMSGMSVDDGRKPVSQTNPAVENSS